MALFKSARDSVLGRPEPRGEGLFFIDTLFSPGKKLNFRQKLDQIDQTFT